MGFNKGFNKAKWAECFYKEGKLANKFDELVNVAFLLLNKLYSSVIMKNRDVYLTLTYLYDFFIFLEVSKTKLLSAIGLEAITTYTQPYSQTDQMIEFCSESY